MRGDVATRLEELPLVLRVEEVAEVLRIGRTSCWEAVRRGDIHTVRIGRLVRVPKHEVARLLGLDNGTGTDGT